MVTGDDAGKVKVCKTDYLFSVPFIYLFI